MADHSQVWFDSQHQGQKRNEGKLLELLGEPRESLAVSKFL